MMQKQPRIRDKPYLEWLHSQPCCLCGSSPVHAAHIRSGSIAYDKPPTGMGEKPSDCWCLPQCPSCHGTQHSQNELEFWRKHGIDPFALALRYYGLAVAQGHSKPTAVKPRSKRKIQSRGFR